MEKKRCIFSSSRRRLSFMLLMRLYAGKGVSMEVAEEVRA